ncbi:MAG: hypothetical protein PHN57_07910 [Candidatus Omnitrophica bacterium]|nr:hypothetical protein [Candidatus Omnitrophota bacterium]
MKKPVLFLLFCMLALPAASVFSADYGTGMEETANGGQNGADVPQGMEILHVGPTRVLVPFGTKITRKDGLIILEGIDEYVARQLLQMREKIAELEKNQEILLNEIDNLKRVIKNTDANSLSSEDKDEKEQQPQK